MFPTLDLNTILYVMCLYIHNLFICEISHGYLLSFLVTDIEPKVKGKIYMATILLLYNLQTYIVK